MKAQDLAQAVYTAEKELAAEIAETVNKKLAELSDKTGLMLGDITISTIETTSLGDKGRRWIVSSTRIDSWIPDAISTDI